MRLKLCPRSIGLGCFGCIAINGVDLTVQSTHFLFAIYIPDSFVAACATTQASAAILAEIADLSEQHEAANLLRAGASQEGDHDVPLA